MTPAISQTPYFGRAFQIQIASSSGAGIVFDSESWTPEPLKLSFVTEITALQAYGFCDLTIYNLNARTDQVAATPGNQVSISAGYQNNFSPNTSLIWSGPLFQQVLERENVTNLKLTLRCLLAWLYDSQNFVSLSQAAGGTAFDMVNRIANESQNPIPIEQIDQAALSQKKYPRGQAIHGRPGDYLNRIAKDNGLAYWISPNGLNVRSLAPQSPNPDFIFGPPVPPGVQVPANIAGVQYTPTLIGTPQQTDQGVTFRVLMDSRPKIGSLVMLNMVIIRKLLLYPGGYPSRLDQDGMYVVAGIKHIGDTRGNDWYTEIVGITRSFWDTKAGLL